MPLWYGKMHLNPARTKKLMQVWQAPPGNTADYYYDLFPELYPYYLPDDHHKVKYNEENYPKHRDYRNKPEMPDLKKLNCIECVECVECAACKEVKKQNKEQIAKYYADLEVWKNTVRDVLQH